jgi:hypothetical protein
LPWPMLFTGPPDEGAQSVVLHDSSDAQPEINLDLIKEMTFESLGGRRLEESESAKRISREIEACKQVAAAVAQEELARNRNASSEHAATSSQQSDGADSAPIHAASQHDGRVHMDTGLASVGAAKSGNKAIGADSAAAATAARVDVQEDGAREKKRRRESEEAGGDKSRAADDGSAAGAAGKQLRAIKPHDAAVEVLRGKPEGLTLDEIVRNCQHLPRKLDVGNSRPGTQGMDARGALRHALTAGCTSSSQVSSRKRVAAFTKSGDRYLLLQEFGRDALGKTGVAARQGQLAVSSASAGAGARPVEDADKQASEPGEHAAASTSARSASGGSSGAGLGTAASGSAEKRQGEAGRLRSFVGGKLAEPGAPTGSGREVGKRESGGRALAAGGAAAGSQGTLAVAGAPVTSPSPVSSAYGERPRLALPRSLAGGVQREWEDTWGSETQISKLAGGNV